MQSQFSIKADPDAQKTIAGIKGKDLQTIIYLIPLSGAANKVREDIATAGAKEFGKLSNHLYIAALVSADQASLLADSPHISAIVNKRGDQMLASATPTVQ